MLRFGRWAAIVLGAASYVVPPLIIAFSEDPPGPCGLYFLAVFGLAIVAAVALSGMAGAISLFILLLEDQSRSWARRAEVGLVSLPAIVIVAWAVVEATIAAVLGS